MIRFPILILLFFGVGLAPADSIALWEEKVPYAQKDKAEEVITEKRPGQFRVTEITDPFIEVYPANPDKHNGRALIICPGGGYKHLAHEKVGSDIAEYFSAKGFTCFVLLYQVPDNREGALSDAMQAVHLVRERADEWQVDPDQIGMVGSSAGGHLVAATSVQTTDLSKRPNFAIVLCGAYLNNKDTGELSPEFSSLKGTPPFFLFVAADDRSWVDGSLVFGRALAAEDIPFALHVAPKGGHGFGVKQDNPAGRMWGNLAIDWIDGLFEED